MVVFPKISIKTWVGEIDVTANRAFLSIELDVAQIGKWKVSKPFDQSGGVFPYLFFPCANRVRAILPFGQPTELPIGKSFIKPGRIHQV